MEVCTFWPLTSNFPSSHPLPLVTRSLISFSMSLVCWFVCLFLDYTYKYLSFSVWLILLSIMTPKSNHVVTNGRISSFFMAEYYSILYIYHNLFIHSSIDGHWDCFHVLTIVNNTAMNMGVQISFQVSVFVPFGDISRNGIARLYGSSIFNFLRIIHTVFYSGYTNLHSHQ